MIDFELLARELGPDPAISVVRENRTTESDVEAPPADWHDESDHGLIQVKELPAIVDASEFVAISYPPSPELIKGLVHQGTKVVVGGGSKSFKTWVQLDAAISVAYGLPWMECETVAGKVLFVNLEIAAEFFQKRIAKIVETRGIQQCPGRLDIWNLRGHSAPYRIILPRIIARIKEVGYSLIVLDPIYKLYGNTDENSASEVAQLLNELERVCVETGAAVLFGAHYSKGNQSAKESIDRISGSGVFARDPDTIIPFTRHEDEGSFVVEPILRNLPPVSPFVVTWNHPLMERNEELDPAKLKQAGGRPKEHDAASFIAMIPETGLTDKELGALGRRAGMSRATFYRVKKQAREDDLLWWSEINQKWMASKIQA